ncbi:MAG: hypothetical protein FWB77_05225 [Treponema sp.]|nr:hypothetical protein [Treponema sp.]
MKINKIIFTVLIVSAFCMTGCLGLFNPPVKSILFSFEEHYNAYATAKINFVNSSKSGVRLVDCDGYTFPPAAQGTQWETSVEFPAGIEMELRVYVYWNEDRFGERRRGVFKCPPLEGNKSYRLSFNGNFKGGKLVLTNAEPGFSSNKVVYEQIIPPVRK